MADDDTALTRRHRISRTYSKRQKISVGENAETFGRNEDGQVEVGRVSDELLQQENHLIARELHLVKEENREANTGSTIKEKGKLKQAALTNFFKPKSTTQDALKRLPFGVRSSSGSVTGGLAKSDSKTSNPVSNQRNQRKRYTTQLYLSTQPRQCPQCFMTFTPGSAEDEQVHNAYHKKVVNGIEWSGYKDDSVLMEFKDAKIVVVGGEEVVKSATTGKRKKCTEILDIIASSLGSVPISDSIMQKSKLYIYIQNKRVIGAVVAERIQEGFRRVLADDSQGDEGNGLRSDNVHDESTIKFVVDDDTVIHCSPQPTPTPLGISRIWVHPSHRKKGIATRLLTTICSTFIYGMNIKKDLVAFSQPTRDGTHLAMKFTGIKDFLVYFENGEGADGREHATEIEETGND